MLSYSLIDGLMIVTVMYINSCAWHAGGDSGTVQWARVGDDRWGDAAGLASLPDNRLACSKPWSA